jgi:hypothetical protein
MPHRELWHRCSVCGKPRTPSGPGNAPPTTNVTAALRRASHAHKTVGILAVLFFFLLASGLFSLVMMLLFLWVSQPGPLGLTIGLVLGAIPLLLAAYSRRAQGQAQATRKEALLAAYSEQIIATLTELGTPADAKRIAEWFALRLDHAEALLANLNVDERMSSNITDDGDLEFSVVDPARRMPAEETRLRVDVSQNPTTTPLIVEAELDEREAPLEDASAKSQSTRRP